MELKEKIKLIIWDMDDTFWDGAVSEGEIVAKKENIELIKTLTDRGIMNSISSKNDFDTVKNKLDEFGIFDLFVFPKINWNAKGEQIKTTIDECHLRPVNVLFIDDNIHNLEEAKHVCPGLNVSTPDIIKELLKSPPPEYIKGSPDVERTRLKQFKLLESKTDAVKDFSANDEFLRKSNIKVSICDDCLNHKDRIYDLINRTNQLNFTKIRLTEPELDTLLHNNEYKNYYVTVTDNFGDYGIVGFISVKDNKAEHFLFSCRITGMGVEQYVYSKLGYPDTEIIGEVISSLDKSSFPDWINQVDFVKGAAVSSLGKPKNKNAKSSIILRGGCDLFQMTEYLRDEKIDCEINFGGGKRRDHTCFYKDILNNYPELPEIKQKVPFLLNDTFDTEIFSNKHKIVILSLLMDYSLCVYKMKSKPEVKIAFSFLHSPLTKTTIQRFNLTEEQSEWFFENFENCGLISLDEFRSNLELIRSKLNEDVHLILINGCEVNYIGETEPDKYLTHIEYNKVVDDFVQSHPKTHLLDVRKFVTGQSDCTDCISHYKRHVYYKMALELASITAGIRKSKLRVKNIYIEKILSFKNNRNHKVVTFLGIKMKFKRRIKS